MGIDVALRITATVLVLAIALGERTSGGESARSVADGVCRSQSASTWRASFDDGTFGGWSVWTQPRSGIAYVTTPRRAGIPSPPCGGRRIAEFGLTKTDLRRDRIHSKLYKSWDVGRATVRRDDRDRPLDRIARGREAGVYSAWFYVPRGYRVARGGPVNIFQFKEDTSGDGGRTLRRSDMQSSVSIFSAGRYRAVAHRTGTVVRHAAEPRRVTRTTPVLAVDVWHPARPSHRRGMTPLPVGRWFEVRAVLRPGDRVAYYVDGRLLDVWTDREYPVGVNAPDAIGWAFGVGHYGANVGRLWVADASATLRTP